MVKFIPNELFSNSENCWQVKKSCFADIEVERLQFVVKCTDCEPIIIDAVKNSDGFVFNFNQSLNAGIAFCQLVAVSGAEKRHIISSRRVKIHIDLSNVDANYDYRTHAEKMLQAINELLEDRITDKAEELEYNPQYGASRKLKFASKSELYSLKMRYTEIIRSEREAEIIKNGGKVYNYEVARFTNV